MSFWFESTSLFSCVNKPLLTVMYVSVHTICSVVLGPSLLLERQLARLAALVNTSQMHLEGQINQLASLAALVNTSQMHLALQIKNHALL
jgi:hypothetical protein